jgi:hypothetical protein
MSQKDQEAAEKERELSSSNKKYLLEIENLTELNKRYDSYS